jgi:hypothetical protein
MPKRAKISKLLVIDASVARSAGDAKATDPISIACRDCLETIRKVCHRMVITTEISAEWNRHQSSFASGWRRWMISKRKFVRLAPTLDPELYDAIGQLITIEQQQAAMLKDTLLVEAAVSSDKIILSLDERVRRLLVVVAPKVRAVGELIWVNPSKVEENCLTWLQQGAQVEQHRQISFIPADTP